MESSVADDGGQPRAVMKLHADLVALLDGRLAWSGGREEDGTDRLSGQHRLRRSPSVLAPALSQQEHKHHEGREARRAPDGMQAAPPCE